MKTMTCQQLGGPCDLPHQGMTADEVIKAQDRHLKEMVAKGDTTHETCLEGDEGPVEESHQGNGVVPAGQAGVCRASRRLIIEIETLRAVPIRVGGTPRPECRLSRGSRRRSDAT